MISQHKHSLVRGYFRRTATPGGGTQKWVRGCALHITFMLVLLTALPLPAQTLPSGQGVELTEVLLDKVDDEDWIRFRFLAPDIAREGGRITYDAAAPDMDVLCNETALPYMADYDLDAGRIAISLSDRPVPFGTADPDATQFIEVYRVDGDRCIWEAF